MKYLKTYESFNHTSIETVLYDFFNGNISESEFYERMDSSILNEGMDIFSGIKNFFSTAKEQTEAAILDVCIKAYMWVLKVKNFAKNVLGKVFKGIIWILNKMVNFREKHPVLFRVILITALLVIFLLLSTATYAAGKTGVSVDLSTLGVDQTDINAYIGYLDNGDPSFATTKAQAMLIDLKDGDIDGSWTMDQIKDVVELCKRELPKSIRSLREQGADSEILEDVILDFIKEGERSVGFTETISKLADGTVTKQTINILKTK